MQGLHALSSGSESWGLCGLSPWPLCIAGALKPWHLQQFARAVAADANDF